MSHSYPSDISREQFARILPTLEFGNARLEWLSRFLGLPNGIPSHDTFGRVFSRLDPDQFGACFMNWVQSVAELTPGEVVAIDGKRP